MASTSPGSGCGRSSFWSLERRSPLPRWTPPPTRHPKTSWGGLVSRSEDSSPPDHLDGRHPLLPPKGCAPEGEASSGPVTTPCYIICSSSNWRAGQLTSVGPTSSRQCWITALIIVLWVHYDLVRTWVHTTMLFPAPLSPRKNGCVIA